MQIKYQTRALALVYQKRSHPESYVVSQQQQLSQDEREDSKFRQSRASQARSTSVNKGVELTADFETGPIWQTASRLMSFERFRNVI